MLRIAVLLATLPLGAWAQTAPTPTAADLAKIKTVEAIDVAVSRGDYIGQMVRIPKVWVWNAQVKSALIRLPGAGGRLELEAMPRAQVKYLVERCSGAVFQIPGCDVTLTAVISDQVQSDGDLILIGVSLEMPPPAGQRQR